MTLLAIESSSTVCGAGIFSNDQKPVIKEQIGSRIHGEFLPVFVDDLLKKYNKNLSTFDGIAVSAGPGSFTGLRIGMSLAKGLALAADIPILPVNTAYSLVKEYILEKNYSLAIYSHAGLVYEQVVKDGEKNGDIQFHNVENIQMDSIFGVNFPTEIREKRNVNETFPSVKYIGQFAMKYSDELLGKSILDISPYYYSDFRMGKKA